MSPIKFAFNERKAAAAAAVILREYGGRMPYLTLVKMLYVAERESLRRRGRPVFGDAYFSMKDGPVVSNVLDRIRHQKTRGASANLWSNHIATEGYDAELVREIETGPLSESELGILHEVIQIFRAFDRWQARDWTHELPEWEPQPENTSKAIPVETLLQMAGMTAEQIEAIREDALRHSHFDSVFGS